MDVDLDHCNDFTVTRYCRQQTVPAWASTGSHPSQEYRAACGQSAQHRVGQDLPLARNVKAAETSRCIENMSVLNARSV
jgi:hypothetical protein